MRRCMTQRALNEVRERPSKAYSWKAFLAVNIAVEIPYQVLIGLISIAAFYYPILGSITNSFPMSHVVSY
jgi:ABC-type multidrug transport system permease subunit